MDLSKLSLAELRALLRDLPAEIQQREKKEKAETLQALKHLAQERGFALEDLISTAAEVRKHPPVPIKYRHPEHPELTWSGRGRQPRWVVELLSKGYSLESLDIHQMN